MCKETPDGEKCQTTYFWKDASVPVLSLGCVKKLPRERNVKRLIFEKMRQFQFCLPVSISVSRDLFDFCFCFGKLFSKAVFDANFGFSCFGFKKKSFWGFFHFWALLWGLVLRPFSTCSSLMSFSPFSRFLWLLSLLVASFFCSLLSRAS